MTDRVRPAPAGSLAAEPVATIFDVLYDETHLYPGVGGEPRVPIDVALEAADRALSRCGEPVENVADMDRDEAI